MIVMAALLGPVAAADDTETRTRDLPGEVMPVRQWDHQHLDLTVEIDPRARTVKGTAVHTVAPLGRRHGWLRLHQVDLVIDQVRVDGKPVEGWRTGRHTLDIPVPAQGDTLEVAVDYHAKPQTGLHFRGAPGTSDNIVEVWSQGEDTDNRHWFPGWDYPNDTFTLSTHVIVPDDLHALSNGTLTGKEPVREGWARWDYRLDAPIVGYLVAVAAGDYAVYEGKSSVPFTYVVPRGVDEAAARRTLAVAEQQMPFFENLLDEPYPYDEYRQVLVQRFMYGGMENATLTVLADRLLLEQESTRDQRSHSTVAHELAHQWFGDLLTCYGWRELWLNEGFATYYTGRWIEEARGPEAAAVLQWRWARAALKARTPMAPRSWSKVQGRENAAVYVRGATVLHMLRVHLGTEVFDRAIRNYVDANKHRLVESEDLRRAMEDASGEHLGWLFDQWVHGAGVPTLTSSHAWKDGTLVVTFEQKPSKGAAPFTAPAEIEIGTATDVLTKRLWIGEGKTRLSVDMKAPPLWVATDPRGGVLAQWKRTQSVEEWIAQLTHSSAPIARLQAMEALGKSEATDASVAALRDVLADDSSDVRFRQYAASALGKLGTKSAIDALVEVGVPHPDAEIRERTADALGDVPPTDQVKAVLQALARRDDDSVVRVSAVLALAKGAEDEAVLLARMLLGERDDPRWPALHRNAVGVLGKHGEERDLSRLLKLTARDHHRATRHAAARAAVALFTSLGDERQKALRPRVSETLSAMLDDDDVRTRSEAVHLLGKVGDEGAHARLGAFASSNTVVSPDLSSLARAAALKIRRRGQGPPSKPETPDEAALEERLDELERRLQRVEEWR